MTTIPNMSVDSAELASLQAQIDAINATLATLGDGTANIDINSIEYAVSVARFQTLTNAATTSWDHDSGTVAKVLLTQNTTLANPTNGKRGTQILIVEQGGLGAYTFTFDTEYVQPDGVDVSAFIAGLAAGQKVVLTFASDTASEYLVSSPPSYTP